MTLTCDETLVTMFGGEKIIDGNERDSKMVVKRKRASWKMRLMAVLLGTIVSLMIGEVGVLLSGVNNPYRAPATSMLIPHKGGPYNLAPNGYVPYSTIRTTYPTNPRGYFDYRNGIDHKFNSEGWRDDEHSETKPPGTIRILGLGDSYLFGQGVKREDLFIEKLGKQLTEQLGGRPVETINTGQPAYNTWMELRLLKERGLAFQPDLVLLCFVPNDVEPDVFAEGSKIEFLTEYTQSYAAEDWLSNYSELWMFLRRSIAFRVRAKQHIASSVEGYLDDSEKWKSCRKSLLEIRDVCQKNEIPLLVVVFPFLINLDGAYPFQPIHDQVTSTCIDEGIKVLDLREKFRSFHGPELWVHPTDQHPNEAAHDIAASVIFKKIVSDELIMNTDR